MCFGKPQAPAATPAPPVAQPTDPAVLAAQDRDRRRRAAGLSGSTNLSGGQGAPMQPSAPKSLLSV